jgi:hypothetical protein
MDPVLAVALAALILAGVASVVGPGILRVDPHAHDRLLDTAHPVRVPSLAPIEPRA